MANPIIILDNSTASPITLVQLGLLVPGSGSILATDSVLVSDVVNDRQLHIFVDAGDITLTVNAVALTEEQSKAYIGYDRIKVNNEAAVGPTVNEDADAGYRVGSTWINTTADTAYVCVDATNNAAVWLPIGGADAFGVPVTVGTVNAQGSAATHTRSDHVHAHGNQTVGTLHAIVTPDPGGVAGFMSPADKQKLDALVGTVGDTEFSSVSIATTLGTFQDAFPGQNITVTVTGDYYVWMNGNINGSSGSTVNEIGLSNNGIIIVNSQRLMQGNGGAAISVYCDTFQSLTAGDIVTGRFRKASGPGTTTMDNRRFSILRLSVTP
jgi:hypothetical protein